MGNTRGPCKCQWCPAQALSRAGSVQLCERCQRMVNRVARAAYGMQKREALSNGEMGRILGISPVTWSKTARALERNARDDVLSKVIDPRHPLGNATRRVAAGETVDDAWQNRAECRGSKHPDMFFPHPSTRKEEIEDITRACAPCPVKIECASLRRRDEGIWGGRYHPPSRAHRT